MVYINYTAAFSIFFFSVTINKYPTATTVKPTRYARSALLNNTAIETLIVKPIESPINTLYTGALFTGVNLNSVVKNLITAFV